MVRSRREDVGSGERERGKARWPATRGRDQRSGATLGEDSWWDHLGPSVTQCETKAMLKFVVYSYEHTPTGLLRAYTGELFGRTEQDWRDRPRRKPA